MSKDFTASTNDFLDAEEMEALRVSFRAEEDERLGRWRWTENPDYVVYANTRGILVFSESTGLTLTASRDQYSTSLSEPTLFGAASAYFDAHPEPKPWHDAQVGETWVLLGAHLGIAVTAVGSEDERWFTRATVFGKVERYELNDRTITEARRIWPEVSA